MTSCSIGGMAPIAFFINFLPFLWSILIELFANFHYPKRPIHNMGSQRVRHKCRHMYIDVGYGAEKSCFEHVLFFLDNSTSGYNMGLSHIFRIQQMPNK